MSLDDDARWDRDAVRSRDGHILQSAAWGRIRQAQGWRAEQLRVGDPLPLALVLWKDLPAGLRFAYVPRGPVFDHREPAQLEAALEALRRRAREERAIFLKVDPEVPRERDDLLAVYRRCGFARSAEDVQPVLATLEIDLRRQEEAILADLDKDTRWSVRQAERRGVEVAERADDAALAAFYEIYALTGRRARFITRARDYYLAVWGALLSAGYASLLVALVEGRIVAGAMLFWCGNRAIYMYGASDDVARRTFATYGLQWRCIRLARERGCARYDLGGVPLDPAARDPMRGVYLFKKGFGGARREFAGAHDTTPRPLLYRLWLLAEPRAYAALARLRGQPVALAR